ncbi:unnamed protein product, partial [Vitis vinifera]
MEEEAQGSTEVAVLKVVENIAVDTADPIKVTNGDLHQEETALDGEFIKVEKELIDNWHQRIVEVEEKHGIELKNLQDALEAHEVKHKELIGVKEAFDNLSLELESSMKKMGELESELQVSAGDARNNAARMQELCDDLETKLKQSDENFCKTDSLLSQALANNAELEEKLKSQEALHQETGTIASTATQKKVEEEKKELKGQMQEYEDKITQLESALSQSSLEKSELGLELKSVAAKCTEHEDRANSTHQRSLELEDLMQLSHSKKYLEQISDIEAELQISRAESKSLEKALELASETERDITERLNISIEKLKSAEEQLEQQGRIIEQSTARSLELEELHETLKRDSEFKLNEAIASLSSRDSEAQSLYEKLKSHEDQVKTYELQVADTAEKSTSLKEELERCLGELAALQSTNEELKVKISEAEIKEAEIQLEEAVQRFTHRDSEAKELNEKLTALESQIKVYEEQAHEASAISETRKVDLEQTLLKLKDLESVVEELQTKLGHFEKESEGLAEANLKLTQELAAYESKMNDLQEKLLTAFSEKDETVEQLQFSKKGIEDLRQQLATEGQKLQSQVSSVMEENNLLNETYQAAKNELQAVIIQLEGQLKEQKANEDAIKAEMENLKAEIADKSVLQTRLDELEKQLVLAEARLKEEVETVQAAAAGREAELNIQLEDHVRKVHDRDILSGQVVQLQEELHLAHTSIAEKTVLQTRLEELEKQLVIAEAQLKEEVESVRAAAVGREAELSTQLEEHARKVQDRDSLSEQVVQLQKELHLAQTSIVEQKETHSQKELEREAAAKHLLEELEAKKQELILKENQVKELEQKLQLAEAKSKEKADGGSPSEGMEVKSRDIGLVTSTPSRRKSKKKSEGTSPQTSSSSEIHARANEVSSAMTLKFILGVALVSVIVGIILGKRY